MGRNMEDWIKVILCAAALFLVLTHLLGFELAKSLIGFTNYPALIITGALAIFLGIHRSRWSLLFGAVSLVLIFISL